ncbi:c-type cytochrome [Chryseobacterium sp. A301]
MKKIAMLVLMGAVVIACSKKGEDSGVESNVMLEEPVASVDAAPAQDEGLTLIQGMDCLTCHKEDATLIGPSYKDVAAKYTDADKDVLAKHIIEGSVGVWGQIPMTPHAGLSQENAIKMVEYILTLK